MTAPVPRELLETFNQLCERLGALAVRTVQDRRDVAADPALEALATSLELLEAAVEELEQQAHRARNVQADLETTVRRYESLFDYDVQSRLITDDVGTIRMANHSAAELLRTPLEDLTGMPLATFVTYLDRALFHQRVPGIGADPQRLALNVQTGDGGRKAVDAWVRRAPDGDDLWWTLLQASDAGVADGPAATA